ncbi:MAG: hypothetical protein IPH93_17670 [Saprospiraceae bacterium]|nr:hypothetical protein [Saprospiraceae bacterium]MBK7809764.1 hypothetical protein [Saprospiraceae bacterium]MBK9632125.1 hypothetical protein [Saprospiraceae bacterium]
MKYLKFISSADIKKYVQDYHKKNKFNHENYKASLNLIKYFPMNKKYGDIFIKVNFINGAFKTSIGDTDGVSRHIFEKVNKLNKLDIRLRKGDISLVHEIAQYVTSKNKKHRNNYSFASKYCHCHNPEAFPINDKFVRNSLYEFNKYLKYSKFKKVDLYDYNKFVNILSNFKLFLNDKSLDSATIDRFLWAVGKENDKRK